MNKTSIFDAKNRSRLVYSLLSNSIYMIVLVMLAVLLFAMDLSSIGPTIRLLMEGTGLWGLMALGMMFVIILGHIDLSIGMSVSMLSVIVAMAVNKFGIVPAIILTIIIAVITGAINGVIVAYLGVNAFIATLGTMSVYKGIGQVLCHSTPVPIKNIAFGDLWTGHVLSIGKFDLSYPIVTIIIVLILTTLLMKYTQFGQDIYTTGGNRDAANMVGVNTKLVTFICFCITGFLAGMAAVILASYQLSGNAIFGENYALMSITACVVGGVRMSGGFGTPIRAVLGVAVIQLLQKIFYTYASQYANMVNGFIGVLLIIMLIVDMFSNSTGSRIKIKKV